MSFMNDRDDSRYYCFGEVRAPPAESLSPSTKVRWKSWGTFVLLINGLIEISIDFENALGAVECNNPLFLSVLRQELVLLLVHCVREKKPVQNPSSFL